MPYDIPDAYDEVAHEPEVVWAAGLFEGEGCLTISDGCARLKLNSTDEDIVRRFHDAVGVGQVREERTQEKRGYKRQWEWYVANKEGVQMVIRIFWSHFGNRRRDRALDLIPLTQGKD